MRTGMKHPLDWETLRQRLAADGRQSWRGLEELAAGEEFQELLRSEFPEEAPDWSQPLDRRRFLTLLGASLALAGVAGCSSKPAPSERIMPYVTQPEVLTPGRPLFYATAMPLCGLATGLLVKTHEGRPTKVEGNPRHPASLGATDAFAQASILGLYDPERSQSATHLGQPRAWDEALSALRAALEEQEKKGGEGLRVLTGSVTSPSLADLLAGERSAEKRQQAPDSPWYRLRTMRERFAKAKWYQHEPARSSNALDGAALAFGKKLNTIYHFGPARVEDAEVEDTEVVHPEVVLSLDADFLSCGPAHLRYVREFANRRRMWEKPDDAAMNRLYVVETMPTTTGAAADHRLPLRPSEIEGFARAIAAELKVGVKSDAKLSEDRLRWARAVAADLRKHEGRCVVLAGDAQPPSVHALAHAMNEALKNFGRTVTFTAPVEARPAEEGAGLRELTKEMRDGGVEVLLILGVNPVFTAPADLEFEKALQEVRLRAHVGLYQDETAVQCHWHIPEAHYLEAWGDARAFDGRVTIMQPMIEPLYRGHTVSEVAASLFGESERPGREIVRDYWHENWPKKTSASDFDRDWERALHRGFIVGSAFESVKPPSVQMGWADRESVPRTDGMEIVFRPDPTILDGRFANNGWLQELPKPLTRLTWGNAAFVSPATAERLGLSQHPGANGGEHGQAIVDELELRFDGRTVRAPAWILPGHADDAVTVHLGHGRTNAGEVGNGSGFNAYLLRTTDALWSGGGLTVRKTGERHTLACVQMHHNMQGREPVRAATLEEYRENPHFVLGENPREQRFQRELVPGAQHPEPKEPEADRRLHPLTLYTQQDRVPAPRQWGMAVDLTACVGCGACVAACQAENNIPVVGKEQVTRGREMHWLRIDRYYVGGLDNPETHFQPVPCQHCENAPCEIVCPVGATVHSADGLNDMVYNRCVGTRYCSNNCPYKVRRFNFLAFADFATESLKLGRNPQVTTRSRGVMEKCTYCVQRIRNAEIDAEVAGRPVADGDVVTACQQACPARAIVFGDMNDPKSKVTRTKAAPLTYGLLADLNTRPRTTYLAALRNPNPELA
jgi:molybdopterin-containing oxidoreductase family iron-sulfur binding subunit